MSSNTAEPFVNSAESFNQNSTAAKKATEKDAHVHSQPSEKPIASQSSIPSFFNWGKSQEYQADHPENYTNQSTIESIKDTAKSTLESIKDTIQSTFESAKDTTKSVADAPQQSQAPSFFNWGKSQEYQADHPENYANQSTIESIKESAKSNLESAKDTAQSTFESAKDTAQSTFESAKDTAKSVADAPQQSQAPSFFNWGKSQEYQADHPESYANQPTLDSIKESAKSALESAKNTAQSTFESAKDTAQSTFESAKDTAQSTLQAAKDTVQPQAPSFLNWGKSQEYQADHPENYANQPTLDSIKESAKSNLESAKDTAQSSFESAKDTANSTLQSAKDTVKSTAESAKDTAQSTLQSAKDTTNSTLQSAKDTAQSAKDTAQSTLQSAKDTVQPQAPSFLNWGKSQEYQADHPESYANQPTLDSIKESAKSALESAKDTAQSSFESAKDSAKSTLESAKDAMNQNTVPQNVQKASEEIVDQDRAPSFFNWGKSQEYQADHPENYARENISVNEPQNITDKIGGTLRSVLDSTIDAVHLPRHDRPTQTPSQFGNNESH